MEITRELLRRLSEAPSEIVPALAAAHEADVAEALNQVDPALAAKVIPALPFDFGVRVLEHPEFELRITAWQVLGFYDYGPYWPLVALTVGVALVGVVTFGSLGGSMLPFVLRRLGFDPASASAPFGATLVDVTGFVIYFGVAYLILRGTLL